MIRKTFTFLLILFCSQAFAQDRYVVQLTDKNNSPYSISTPSAYLSPRAIQRRTNQGIAVDISDLPVNPSYIIGLAATGATVLSHSKWLNTVTVQTSSQAVLNNIDALPYVDTIKNVGRYAHGINNQDTDKFRKETLMKNNLSLAIENRAAATASFDYGPSLNQIAMLGGDVMHDNGYTGMGIVIAVIDAGFYNADNMVVFDSLRANNQILGTWDFVSNDANVYDDDPHGSEVLSIMGGNWPGNIVGTAPKANYWLLRSEDNTSENIIEEYNWATAAEFADSAGADVINSSLGYTEFDNPAQNHTYADMEGNTCPSSRAADFAAAKGMVVEVSAGNEGNSPWMHISAPADADSILATGAVDDMENYVGFSSVGPSADGDIKPNVAAQGAGTFVADIFNGGVFPGSGTSFAGPLISGMAACLWQCHPNASNMEIINAIQHSASQFNNPDSLLGYGIPDFPQACLYLGGINPDLTDNGDNLWLNSANPFNSTLEFSFYSDTNQRVDIRICDMLGKVVYHSSPEFNAVTVTKFSAPLSLSKGVYVIKAVTEERAFSKKIIKY